MTTSVPAPAPLLPTQEAASYAEWFACLADPTRVRVLHATAVAGRPVTVGELTDQLGISQSTCSHHLRKLAETGFVRLRRAGTATLVTVNAACATELPLAADVVMGLLVPRATRLGDLPADVTVRPLGAADWPAVRRVYAQGIATGDATFETDVPPAADLDAKWLPGHRWVAEHDGHVAGWAAVSPVSARACYAGVGETSVYVGAGFHGRGVGRALLHQQITAADAGGLWTLQTSIFPENRSSLALHHTAGFRTVGVRERIAEHHGRWRDTVLLERRSPTVPAPAAGA